MTWNVGNILGLDEGCELLDQARARWSDWTATDARLAVVTNFDDLRDWLMAADPQAADQVLLALAMLAATDGGDDIAAAGALAKCLLPGASRLAAWFATERRAILPGDLCVADELVASQLWIEVRTFNWRTGQKVAANILMNARAAILRDCGDGAQLSRHDQTWLHTDLLEHFSTGEGHSIDPDSSKPGERHPAGAGWRPGILTDPTPPPGDEIESPREQLLEILEQACAENVISDKDRSILLCLVEEADRLDIRRTGRGSGGLMANDLSQRVGEQVGLSQQTVRRRTAKSMQALAATVPARFSDGN